MINIKIGLMLFMALPAIVLTIDYCSSEFCKPTVQHIACNNSGNFSSACGSNARIIEITPALRKLILYRHNVYRNAIAGGFKNYKPAVRMAAMVWSPELSRLAEYNVKQCAVKHDACRNTKNYKYAGQNLAAISFGGLTKTVANIIETHIQLWFNEHKLCDMATINSYSTSKKVGHFTSMVQEKSTHVGCAILRHKKLVQNIPGVQQLMACNYAFTNVVGNPVYRSGKAASQCTTGVNRKYKFLCSIKEKYNVTILK